MNVFIVVLESVLILLGIGFIGFWITQRKILPESALSFLSRLAIDIALPSVVFASIMVNFSPQDYPNWWQLPLWWVLFTALIFCSFSRSQAQYIAEVMAKEQKLPIRVAMA